MLGNRAFDNDLEQNDKGNQISELKRAGKYLAIFSDMSTGNFVLDLDYKADYRIYFVHSFESLFESIASISLSTFLLCRSCKLAWRYKV